MMETEYGTICEVRRIPRLLMLIVFCYLLSGQPFDSRDPIGRELGWHVYAQLVLFVLSTGVATIVWLRSRVKLRLSAPASLLLLSLLLTVLSSVRSFWPTLSLVKSAMALMVVILAVMLCAVFRISEILRAIYYSIVTVYIIALVCAVLLPSIYPSSVIDPDGRQRVALFADDFGDYAYMTGFGILIGGLPNVRAPWYLQMFLMCLTVVSGSRACTCAVAAILVIAVLLRIRKVSQAAGVCAVGAAFTLLILILMNGDFGPLSNQVHQAMAQFYGPGAVEQSPLEFSGRLELWRAAAGIFESAMFLGYGFGGARDQLLDLMSWAGGAHNGFLELLLAGGALGLILFVAGWAVAVWKSLGLAMGRRMLTIHSFLFIAATTGPSFTMFQYFGVLLIISLFHGTTQIEVPSRRNEERSARRRTLELREDVAGAPA